MRILSTLLIFVSGYCIGQEFGTIDHFILQENRDGILFAVTAGTSRGIWINCPIQVYEELYQDQSGYSAIMHLHRKIIEGNPAHNNHTIEKLLMLAILGEPSKGERSLNEEKTKVVWGISRIRSDAVLAGLPDHIDDWKIWASKLDPRNISIGENIKRN